MRDDIDRFLEIIHEEGGWRAFALNFITLTALCVMLYALVVLAPAVER